MYLRLALAGDPVAHSRSPDLQREAMRQAGIEGEYRAVRTDADGLASMVEDLRSGSLHGMNVTMPLKGAAWELCDETTTEAGASRSVNALRCRDGKVEGHSTDAETMATLYEDMGDPGAPLLILGAGGSARAALVVKGARPAWISARDSAKARSLASEFDAEGTIRWSEGLQGAIVVNATPLGMKGEMLANAVLETASALIDLPYAAAPTPAANTCAERGIRYVGGLEFLARQAAASFRWWTGVAVDSEALGGVLRNV